MKHQTKKFGAFLRFGGFMKRRKCVITVDFKAHNEQLVRSIMFTEFEIPQKILKYTKNEQLVYKVNEKHYKKKDLLNLSARVQALGDGTSVRLHYLAKPRILLMSALILLCVTVLKIDAKPDFYIQHRVENAPNLVNPFDYRYIFFDSTEELVMNYALSTLQRFLNDDIEISNIAKTQNGSFALKMEKKPQEIEYAFTISDENESDLFNFTTYTGRNDDFRLKILYGEDKNLINREISQMEKALVSFDSANEKYGFPSFIDVENFINYIIFTEITANSTATSPVFYKNNKIKVTNVDFSGIFDENINEFVLKNEFWFEYLFKNEKFVDSVIDRYFDLRNGVLSDLHVENFINEVFLFINDEKNMNINEIIRIIQKRCEFLDENIRTLKALSHRSVNKQFIHE